jgi:hypothetical protein
LQAAACRHAARQRAAGNGSGDAAAAAASEGVRRGAARALPGGACEGCACWAQPAAGSAPREQRGRVPAAPARRALRGRGARTATPRPLVAHPRALTLLRQTPQTTEPGAERAVHFMVDMACQSCVTAVNKSLQGVEGARQRRAICLPGRRTVCGA